MTSLISLRIWLGFYLITSCEVPPAAPPQETLRIFADVEHTGILTGPLPSTSREPNEFGIAVPLPSGHAGRDRWPDRFDADDPMVERLGRLRVETAPGAGDLVISIASESRRSLRLFRKGTAGWRHQAPGENRSWTLAPGKDGVVTVGVGVMLPEAKGDAAQATWPRAFTVEIATDSPDSTPVRVPFRVAPFVIPSALEPVDELLIVAQDHTVASVGEVEAFAARSGITLVSPDVDELCDQWMQDTIEPGIFSFPIAAGSGQARTCLSGVRKRSGPASANLDNQIATWLRLQRVVTVAPGAPRRHSRSNDWYGNVEATPPHTDRKGRRFPYGRVITGKHHETTMHPGVLKFLEAQGVQWPPIVLDTSWLTIGHIDEVASFVPATGKAGFKVLLPSPKAARAMLQTFLAKGIEDELVFAATEDEMTLGELRMTVAQTSENLAIDEAVARLREQLKRELSLEDSEFVMLPTLFQGGMAVIPNPVNSVVVNGYLLVPKPFGPQLNGQDGFEKAIREALVGCDVRVVFIDSWDAYHMSGGEIHCGTNTFRRLRDPAWWKQ
jgi:protein-arginine deiminase